MTVVPTHTDVLLGRGVATNRHRGNENFRAIVARHIGAYAISTKKQKMVISKSVVDHVRNSLSPPGRFLAKDPATNQWREVDQRRALEKTAQALRDGGAHWKRLREERASNRGFLDALDAATIAGKKHRRVTSAPSAEDLLRALPGGGSRGKKLRRAATAPPPKSAVAANEAWDGDDLDLLRADGRALALSFFGLSDQGTVASPAATSLSSRHDGGGDADRSSWIAPRGFELDARSAAAATSSPGAAAISAASLETFSSPGFEDILEGMLNELRPLVGGGRADARTTADGAASTAEDGPLLGGTAACTPSPLLEGACCDEIECGHREGDFSEGDWDRFACLVDETDM